MAKAHTKRTFFYYQKFKKIIGKSMCVDFIISRKTLATALVGVAIVHVNYIIFDKQAFFVVCEIRT